MHTFEGRRNAAGLRFAVVVSRFNEFITKPLLEGALDAFRRHGGADEDVTIVWVPGAFEQPLVAKRLAESGSFDAVVCLGAVIRGATAHFDLVAGQSASGIASAALDTGVPIMNGILTTDTIEQAIERTGTKAGNKGFDVAVAAVEMADVLRQIPAAQGGTKP
ncbi:MAG: 6,7-dimethyl-8-ribityllumazine synthase [Chloroflexi bacterium]|nr:6,7-dimethyl-8-ribityllumazine synthase [Chloroflexota bacterium]